MKTRRDFLRKTALGAGVAPLLPTWASSASPRTSPEDASVPAHPLTARHRNLFNGDTCVFFYNPERWQPDDFKVVARQEKLSSGLVNHTVGTPTGGPFKAVAIHNFVKNLAQNGIDTFVINANASRAWYPSKTIPSILDGYKRGDREFFRGHAICQGITEPAEVEKFMDRFMAFFNLYQDLLDQGVDWLAETSKACRAQRISPWVSIRMNDLHGYRNMEGSFFNLPLLKQPEMRLKQSTYSPTMVNPAYREGMNYEKPEVRKLMFEQIREVVEDYDFEGLELDWWRQPLCCEPNASPQTVAMMNDWIRQIRALTERRARKTGKPYPLGLRIPGQLETLKSIGLDVVTLAREGTLDFVNPSGFWCTTWDMPHDELRQKLGDRVAIYGVIEDGTNTLMTQSADGAIRQPIRFTSASREILYANAAGKLALGAQGIEWFNFYCTDQNRIPGLGSEYAYLRDIHRLDHLRGQPKHYAFSLNGGPLKLIPFEPTPPLPVRLEPGFRHAFRLPMCAEPTDRNLELVVQVITKASDAITTLPVAVNGCWPRLAHVRTDRLLAPCGSLTHHVPEHAGYNFSLPVDVLRDGYNEIVLENGGTQPLTVVALELAVRPKTT